MLPILLGSSALKEYGYECQPKDIDLLISNDMTDFFKSFDKSNNLDIFTANDGTNKLIFESINNSLFSKKNIKLYQNYKPISVSVIVPPLEILYAIKKSHIHRIIPYSKETSVNVDIWKKQMNMYTWIRNKLDYNYLDNVIYGNKKYGLPLELIKQNNETNLEYLMRTIFVKRFDEINLKFGDTNNVMNKNTIDFFSDNVERFIDHDELHKLVAKTCRGILDEPYLKFQKDPSNALRSAMLDYDLYFSSDKKDRYTLIREELLVLLLERKLIPELINCYKKPNIFFTSFNDIKLINYFDDVMANYCTNLCESGHSWLRQYVLDHFSIYSNHDSYNFQDIVNLACNITKVNNNSSNNVESFECSNIFDLGLKKYNEDIASYLIYNEDDDFDQDDNCYESTSNDIHIYFDQNCDCIRVCAIDPINSIKYDLVVHSKNIDLLKKFNQNDRYDNLYFNLNNDNLIYSLSNNVGIFNNHLFVLDFKISDKKYLNIDCLIFDSNRSISENDEPKNFSSSFAKLTKLYCYYSEIDPTCGWQNKHTSSVSKLESYGSCDGILGKLCEELARCYLNISKNSYDYSNNGYFLEESYLEKI